VFEGIILVFVEVLPGFVKRSRHLNAVKAIRPALFSSQVVTVFIIGKLWEIHETNKADFAVFYPILLVFKLLEVIVYGLIHK